MYVLSYTMFCNNNKWSFQYEITSGMLNTDIISNQFFGRLDRGAGMSQKVVVTSLPICVARIETVQNAKWGLICARFSSCRSLWKQNQFPWAELQEINNIFIGSKPNT